MGKAGIAGIRPLSLRLLETFDLEVLHGAVKDALSPGCDRLRQPVQTMPCARCRIERRPSNNPSLKRPESLVAPEQNSVSDSPLHFGAKGGG